MLDLHFCFVCETKGIGSTPDAPNPQPPSAAYAVWSPHPESAWRNWKYGVGLWVSEYLDMTKFKVIGGIAGFSIWWTVADILFGGVYIPPLSEPGRVEEILTPPAGVATDRMVIVGDVNGRLTSMGDRITNPQGVLVQSILEEMGLRILDNTADIATFWKLGDESRVDWVASSLPVADHHCCTTFAEKIAMADHHLVHSTVSLNVNVEGRTRAMRLRTDRWDQKLFDLAVTSRLVDWNVEYGLDFADIQETDDRQSLLDKANDSLSLLLLDCAKETCGESERRRSEGFAIRSEKLSELKNLARLEFQRLLAWKHEHGLNRIPDAEFSELRRLIAERKEEVTRLKDERNLERRNSFVQMGGAEQMRVVAGTLRRSQRLSCRLSNDPVALDSYRAHFQKAFAMHDEEMDVKISDPEDLPQQSTPPFRQVDIDLALRALAKQKAPGPSGVLNIMVRAPCTALLEALWLLFSACWSASKIPNAWTRGNIAPVPKKGDLTIIANYRPVTLTETLRKVFERLLLLDLNSGVHFGGNLLQLSPLQGGFRANRSTVDQVAVLQELILQREHSLGRLPILAFLDIKAAYDSAWRQMLWKLCASAGMSRQMLGILQALSDHNTTQVVVGGMASPKIQHHTGLWQGTILSPVLYAYFINDLCSRLQQCSTWSAGSMAVAATLYADDIALIADDEAHLQQMLKVCEDFSTEMRFKFAPAKCEILNGSTSSPCTLYDTLLPCSRQFVYLGVVFEQNGVAVSEHFTRRMSKARTTGNMFRAAGVGFLGAPAAGHVTRTFIVPQVTYGLAVVRPQAALLKRMESTVAQIGKRLLGVGVSTSTAATRWWLDYPAVATRRLTLHSSWLAHVLDLPTDGSFAVREAYVLRLQKRLRSSCFASRPDERSLTQALSRCSSAYERTVVKRAILNLRNAEFFAKLEQDPENQHLKYMVHQPGASRKAVYATLKEFPDLCRAVEVAALGRITGKPAPCHHCGALANRKHAHLCSGRDPSILLRAGLIFAAVESILRIWKHITGNRHEKLFAQLAEARKRDAENYKKPP